MSVVSLQKSDLHACGVNLTSRIASTAECLISRFDQNNWMGTLKQTVMYKNEEFRICDYVPMHFWPHANLEGDPIAINNWQPE